MFYIVIHLLQRKGWNELLKKTVESFVFSNPNKTTVTPYRRCKWKRSRVLEFSPFLVNVALDGRKGEGRVTPNVDKLTTIQIEMTILGTQTALVI